MIKQKSFRPVVKLLISIFVCHCAGGIGAVFTRQSIPEWYAFINKPSFNPPNWVFAPVWTILYTLMGVAMFLVWRKGLDAPGVKKALGVFLFQLALNSLWSIVFFGARSIRGAFFIILLLWLSILWTIVRFFYISRIAALLIIPYMMWVSFAVVLNMALVDLN